MVLLIAVAIWLPPAEGWPFQEQFAIAFSLVPRIVLASLIAYWVGEFSNSYVLAKLKIYTSGRFLWMRTIGSTIVGQGLDTTVFAVIAFAGILPTNIIITSIISGYIFKVVYEAVITPVTYVVVNTLKRLEGIDVFDRKTEFSPFKFE